MKISRFVSVILSLTILSIFNTARADGSLAAAPSLKYVRVTTNSTIAKFRMTGQDEGLELNQIAFTISANSWIHHQVRNLRLLDENRNVIAGPENIWSTPIVCDCDTGRVIFSTVTNFIVASGTSREFTVIADIDDVSGSIIISYSQGDSLVTGISSHVSSTLSAVRNVDSEKFNGVYIETPLAPVGFARIDSFELRAIPGTDSRDLYMFGIMEPFTSYKVEASADLVQWEEVGTANDPGWSDILNEYVGVVPVKYKEKAFFRLHKIIP